MRRSVQRWISIAAILGAATWIIALSGCANEASDEDVDKDSAELATDGGSDGGLPNCTWPIIDECLDSCTPFDEAEAAYQRNPLDGKIARYDTTGQSATYAWFDKKAAFQNMRGPMNDAAKATLKGGKEFIGKTCKLIPVVAEAYNAGEAVYNSITAIAEKDYCVCPTATKFRRMRWKIPAKSVQCTRGRDCWDPVRKSKTHETYLSSATYHEDRDPVHDGTYMDDWEVKREGYCSASTQTSVVRYRSDGSYYYPIVEAQCGGYSKVFDTDSAGFAAGDNKLTAAKIETCNRWCNLP